jgi:hypothetical protein
MIYQEQTLTDEFIAEVMPLLNDHYVELAPFKDIPLRPDWERYKTFADSNIFRIYTARTPEGTLAGYASFFVQPHMHYSSFIVAACDVFYMTQTHRAMVMVAKNFVEYCDVELKKLGVELVVHRYKIMQPALGKLIKMVGYRDNEVSAIRRL